MAKIIINYNEDEYLIEKNLKKQLKKNSTTWQDIKDCIDEINGNIEENRKTLQELQQSDDSALEDLTLPMKIKRETNKLGLNAKLMVILVKYMSNLALENANKRDV